MTQPLATPRPARRLPLPEPEPVQKSVPDSVVDPLARREWLVTNGLGGYASGTLSGVPSRRYHGVLVAALPAPLGRILMLGEVAEVLHLPGGLVARLGGEHESRPWPPMRTVRTARAAQAAQAAQREPAAGQPVAAPGPFDGPREVGDTAEPVAEAAPPPLPAVGHLREFRLEAGLPIWRYEVAGYQVEKRVFLAHLQNTAYVLYRLLEGAGTVRLEVHPSVHFRPHDAPVSTPLGTPHVLTVAEDRYELRSAWPALPPLRLSFSGAEPSFTVAGRTIALLYYQAEAMRGYESTGEVWCPGFFAADLARGEEAGLIASTESWETLGALRPAEALAAEMERRERLVAQADPRAGEGTPAELVLAADEFVITPGRGEDAARARAAGDEPRSIIAGYHWFTDWGRDAMISLEGLTLASGRWSEAGFVLRTFARHVRDGLIPNLFPEGRREGLYNTADASLWFFHAVDRYLAATGDEVTLEVLLPVLSDIVDHHVRGTRFGIGIDAVDGLLRQGAEGLQLTWMDAKVGDWVVTPRRGKAVEINALWYNALRLLAGWLRRAAGAGAVWEVGDGGSAGEDGGPEGDGGGEGTAEESAILAGPVPVWAADPAGRAMQVAALARRVRSSFNRRFWYAAGGHLYDVVDGERGDDAACRPNQIFALSLPHPVLARERWPAVLETVRQRLLTPVGLRSLAPGEPEFRAAYDGDLRARDAAYHQGTVWAWLIGPFVDAWLRVHPGDLAGARGFLQGFVPHLGEACLGTISEIFDAEPPWTPRGCVSQAWSVAEVLRAWLLTTPDGDGAGTTQV